MPRNGTKTLYHSDVAICITVFTDTVKMPINGKKTLHHSDVAICITVFTDTEIVDGFTTVLLHRKPR